MTKRQRIYTVLCAALLLCVCRNQEEHSMTGAESARIPLQEGWNSHLYITRGGKKQAVVWYGHMVKYDSTTIVHFNQNIEVDFYNESGGHVSNLIARRGMYKENTDDVTAMGSVVVKSDSGITLYTEELRWDNKRAKILSDTLIMITTAESDTIWGRGFESNADLSRRVIRQPWGVGNRHIDLSRVEDEFSSPDSSGSAAKRSLKEPQEKRPWPVP